MYLAFQCEYLFFLMILTHMVFYISDDSYSFGFILLQKDQSHIISIINMVHSISGNVVCVYTLQHDSLLSFEEGIVVHIEPHPVIHSEKTEFEVFNFFSPLLHKGKMNL